MTTRCERSDPIAPSTRDSRYPRATCLAPGQVPGVPLVALAHVEQHDAVAVGQGRLDVGGIDLLDLAADLADDLRAGWTHAVVLGNSDRDSMLHKG